MNDHTDSTLKNPEFMNESISALMDDEASDLEVRRILKEAASSNDITNQWHRFHLASDILRGKQGPVLDLDVSKAVSAAIDQTRTAPGKAMPKAKISHIFGKTAIAATVAFSMVVGVQQYVAVNSDMDAGQLTNDIPRAVVPDGFSAPEVNARTVGATSVGSAPIQEASNTSLPENQDTLDQSSPTPDSVE